MSNRAIVGSIGCIVIGLVSYLLHSPGCLWGLILVIMLVETI
ncbi:hypothetical protein [Clostridium estertheticum]|nr:hypothetical protein [Clostridium estertheticum]